MIQIKKLKGLSKDELDNLFNRFGEDFSSIMIDTVIPIVNDVKKNGDKAVIKYTEKFDGVKPDSLLATIEEIEEGYKNTPPDVLNAFREAMENIEEFHRHQKKEDISYSRDDGTALGMIYHPIDNAALYVPGGKASYPSSILMGVIPAQIAGVRDITIITPPDRKGNVPDIILAVCRELGVKKIFKAGGAQAIAAAGFGTETIKKADIIVGPGNVFVQAAKTYLFSLGIIQIDSMAGPSEVLIIADKKANPKWVAFDLLSQAEHEELATAILITASNELASNVKEEIIKDIDAGGGRHEIKKKSIENNGLILLVENIEEAIEFSNRYGPEHLELIVDQPLDYLQKIKNTGSLFLGRYAPVAIGDYYSGTNHILPTGGAARFSSGVSVDTYLRKTSYQLPLKETLNKARNPVEIMSKLEGFDDKHGGSIEIRFEDD